jgi:hypothetical protein
MGRKAEIKGYRVGRLDALSFVPDRTALFRNPYYAKGYAAGYAEHALITVLSLNLTRYKWRTDGRPGSLQFEAVAGERGLDTQGEPDAPGVLWHGHFDVLLSDDGHWSVRTFPSRRILAEFRRPAMAYVRNWVRRHWLGLPAAERALLHQALRPRKADSEEGSQLLRDLYIDSGHPLADFVDVAWKTWMPMPLHPLVLPPPDPSWDGPHSSVRVKDNVRHWWKWLGAPHHWDSLCGRERYRAMADPEPDRPCQACPVCFRLKPIPRYEPCQQTISSRSAPV